jgi:hypothetical protein
MNVSLVLGQQQYFQDISGFGARSSFNGVLGITLDKTETYGFLSSADGKKIRKFSLATNQVGDGISRKS